MNLVSLGMLLHLFLFYHVTHTNIYKISKLNIYETVQQVVYIIFLIIFVIKFKCMQRYFILGLLLLIGVGVYAQQLAPQSINSAGAKLSSGSGSLSFTVGELNVLKASGSNGNSLGGGFTNGAVSSTSVVTMLQPNKQLLELTVFPNPATDLLQIQIGHTTLPRMQLLIQDMQGREVYSGNYAALSGTIGINTAGYAKGTYILSVRDEQETLLGTYKVLKQ
jgi:hypothetical protein